MQPARGLSDFISAALILHFCKGVRVQFSDPYKNIGKTSELYIFKVVSILTFLKIVLLILPINCKNFANLNSTQSCSSSGDSELGRVSSGWITSPSLNKFGGSYPQGLQTCPFSVGVCFLNRRSRF